MSQHEAFRRALEEAAKVCEKHSADYEQAQLASSNATHRLRLDDASYAAKDCASAIRAIPNPYPASEWPSNAVVVAIHRPEGYEDVHPELLLHDALKDGFDYTICTPPEEKP